MNQKQSGARKRGQGDTWRLDSKRGIEINSRNGSQRDPETGSTLELRNGFFVLHLLGTPYLRGKAHGKLLKEKILETKITSYYGSFLRDLYKSSDFAKKIPGFVRELVGNLMEWWYYSPLEKLFMDETKQELFGISDVTGQDRQEVLRASVAPDIMEHLAAGFLKGGKEALGNYYLGGCSAVFARKSALKNRSHVYFARNMDFPGALVWRYPALIFSHPMEEVDIITRAAGGKPNKIKRQKQPYMYITTAGFPGHGLTGMNSSGIAVSTFVCLSKNFSRKSMLSLDYNHYLFTRSESIEGIRSIIESEQPKSASPHTVVFADQKEAISIEVDSVRSVVRPMAKNFDIHVQTNHFLNSILKKREMEFPLEREDTVGRFRLLKDALDENYGTLDARRMVDIISCNTDLESHTTRILGDFPAKTKTLTSVVFNLKTGDFWVASGKPPGICYNAYCGFNFYRELNGSKARRIQSLKRSSVPVFKDSSMIPVAKTMKESIRFCMLSQEQLTKGKTKEAVRDMEKAFELYSDPGYRYILGILYLMNKQPEDALDTLKLVQKSCIFPKVKKDALFLWIGRCLDILGRRKQAKEYYQNALNRGGLLKNLKKNLKRSLRKPYTLSQVPEMIDYNLMGPLEF